MKLNLGCGCSKIEGFVNVDADSSVQPDLVHNFAEYPLPQNNESVDEVVIFHTIEHIDRKSHSMVFGEINRVLKIGGILLISYPDAEKILKFALENKYGKREYWEKTIFGRGLSYWDFHRCLIFTNDLVSLLNEFGFYQFKWVSEENQEHNTIIQCAKHFSIAERSELVRRDIHAACR